MFFGGTIFGPTRSPVTFERHPDTPHGQWSHRGDLHGQAAQPWESLLQLRHQTSDVDVGLSRAERLGTWDLSRWPSNIPTASPVFAEKFLTKSEPLGTMCSSEISGRAWRIKPNSSCSAAILSPISWSEIAGLDGVFECLWPIRFWKWCHPTFYGQKKWETWFPTHWCLFPISTAYPNWFVARFPMRYEIPPDIWRKSPRANEAGH